jgi:two-component system, NarL family, invasion response regulator UvrY
MLPSAIRVLVVDDDRGIRSRVRRLLADEIPTALIAEAASGEEALTHICAEACDVVVLDIRLPGRSGLDVLPDIRSARPSLPVVVLSGMPKDVYGSAAYKAGAAAFVAKERAPDDLALTIRQVLGERS